MPRTCFRFASAIVLLSVCQLAPAQKFQPKTIQFKGAPEYSDQELLAVSGIQSGALLTQAEMNEHSQKLMDTGVFSNLTFKFDGVDLIINLTPVAQLYPIRLENFPLTVGSDLDKKLHERFPLYHGKVPSDGGLLESVRGGLEGLLLSQGIKATVMAAPYSDIRVHKVTAISFSISDPPVLVGEIHVNPATPALDSKAQEVLAKATGSSYSAEGTPNQLSTYLGNLYRDKGYLEADFHATAQGAAVEASDGIHIPILLTGNPGLLYRLTGVQLAPGLLVSQADFDHQSAIHPGDIADGQHVMANWEYIARQYHNKGYMKANVIPTPAFDRDKGTVSYSIAVEPGPVYTMGKLSVDNVDDELRDAMVAAWPMPAGAVFNEGAIRGFFATHGIHPALERVFATVNLKYTLVLNEPNHTVDVALRLEKKH
jgi:outer membrane protein assembly factor BamA